MKKYWKRISATYQKAFAELCKDHSTVDVWGEIDNPDIWGIFINEPKWVLRHLFDFFDSRNINTYCYTVNGKDWHYGILTKSRLMYSSNLKYRTREKAELACYEKAFELLEAQCK